MTPLSTRVLSNLLEGRTGQKLVPNRSWRIETALKPLLRDLDFSSIEHLVAKLAGGRDEQLGDQVVEALLNNETSFFRDLAAFNLLMEQAMVGLADARRAERRLRIWCAGCWPGSLFARHAIRR
jgi:chemotaxis protein methyltransferase CheR